MNLTGFTLEQNLSFFVQFTFSINWFTLEQNLKLDLSNIKKLTSSCLPKRTVLVNKDNIFSGFLIDTHGKKIQDLKILESKYSPQYHQKTKIL